MDTEDKQKTSNINSTLGIYTFMDPPSPTPQADASRTGHKIMQRIEVLESSDKIVERKHVLILF